MAINTKPYDYVFSNGERHRMTPPEAHRYANRKSLRILQGPNYDGGKKKEDFSGWGWHPTLQMHFRGPRHFAEYLKENNLVIAGQLEPPKYKEYTPPIWTEDLIRRAINVHGIQIGSVMAEALLSGKLEFPEEPGSGIDMGDSKELE